MYLNILYLCLGVTLHKKMLFHIHIDNTVNKAFRNLGFLLRITKVFKNTATKITLYNSSMRSGLEYCNVVWNPYYGVYVKRIERVQKRFLWHVSFSYFSAKKFPVTRASLVSDTSISAYSVVEDIFWIRFFCTESLMGYSTLPNYFLS